MSSDKPGMEENPPPQFEEAATGADAKPLEAKAVQGPIDFATMTEEIIARFPKTLARLAE